MKSWIALWCCVALWGCSGDDAISASPGAGSGGASGTTGMSGASPGSASDAGSGGSSSVGSGQAGDGGDFAHCGPVLAQPRCLERWCWEPPLTLGGNLRAIDGASDGSSVWAMGSHGSALRHCEGRWLPMETGIEAELYAVFHPRADYALAVGAGGTVIEWDGARWGTLPSPTQLDLFTVWGASEGEIWLGGGSAPEGPALFRYDGASFEAVDLGLSGFSSVVRSIHGSSSGDVWVVGDAGGFTDSAHYDGTRWTRIGTANVGGDPQGFDQVVVYADGSVFARIAGLYTSALNRIVPGSDPPAWQSTYSHDTDYEHLTALYRDGTGTPAVVERDLDSMAPTRGHSRVWDGADWVGGADAFAVAPTRVWTDATQAWAVGDGMTLLERGADGVWAQRDEVVSIEGRPLHLGAGAGDGELHLATEHGVYRREAAGWRAVTSMPAKMLSASVAQSGDVFARDGAEGALFRFDGTDWTQLADAIGSWSLFARGPNDVWLAGGVQGRIDGAGWHDFRDFCSELFDGTIQEYRQAPDGVMWLVDRDGIASIDPVAQRCEVLRVTAPAADDIGLRELAWTSDGRAWAVSGRGRVYERVGAELVDRGRVLPSPAEEIAVYAAGVDESTLQVAFTTGIDGPARLVTIDVGATAAEVTAIASVDVPGSTNGVRLLRVDVPHTLVAIDGGVLRLRE